MTLTRDPIINVVYGQIKKGIQSCLESGFLPSAVILIYSGIDTMAYLSMPKNQKDVTPKDFVSWCDRYIRFPCKEQLTGLDLYGARCAMLHSFSVRSKLSRNGKCRMIGYANKLTPEVKIHPDPQKQDLVMVSITTLADVFFKGIDQFLISTYANEENAMLANERFKGLVYTIPIRKET